MIAVIADDFTGAAEIGGICLRHGLKVVIETEPVNGEDADILIIATDTRSLKAKEASVQIASVTRELLKLKPQFIYKKVDSVLRGNIAEEITAQMLASNKRRAIIVAANPVFQRIIRNGQYFIDNIPLHETCFSTDPQYPIFTSSVEQILRNNNKIAVTSIKTGELIPDKGIFVGDVISFDDLIYWSNAYNENTLVAGASGFFNSLLERFIESKPVELKPAMQFGEKSLFVLGSTYPKSSGFFQNIEQMGYYLSNMPVEIYNNQDVDNKYLEYWVNDILHGITSHKKVVASINHPLSMEIDVAFRIKDTIGKLVKQVTDKISLDELLIEGGSTTFMVLNYLGIKKLFPMYELDTGVIRMNLKGKWGFHLTTKPGSYFWPENVWVPSDVYKFNNIAYD